MEFIKLEHIATRIPERVEIDPKVIDTEDKAKPHSDDELVRQLKEAGFSVARRTITKYRKKMGIPSSRQRKDWSKAGGNA